MHINICRSEYANISVCMFMHRCICTYVCICTYIYVYIYSYLFIYSTQCWDSRSPEASSPSLSALGLYAYLYFISIMIWVDLVSGGWEARHQEAWNLSTGLYTLTIVHICIYIHLSLYKPKCIPHYADTHTCLFISVPIYIYFINKVNTINKINTM